MAVDRDVISLCYRIVFGREPSESGLVALSQVAEARNIDDPHGVAKLLFSSQEFKNKHSATASKNIFDTTADVNYRGIKFKLPIEDFTYATLKRNGDYEPYVSDVLFSHLKPGMMFLDAGANLGLFTLPVAKAVGPDGSVIAFEASPRNADLLMCNAIANDLTNVVVYPIGASDENGVVLSRRLYHTSLMALLNTELNAFSPDLELIPVVSIDTFLTYRCNKVDIVKIDVDGYEYRVVTGAQKLLERDKPLVFMEYSDFHQRTVSGVAGADLLRLMFSMGYNATILHRQETPEIVDMSTIEVAVARIDEECAACSRFGGARHLDLFLTPSHP